MRPFFLPLGGDVMSQGILTIETNTGIVTGTAHYQDRLLSISVPKYGAFFQINRGIFEEEEDRLPDIAKKMAVRFYEELKPQTAPTAVQEDSPMMRLIEQILESKSEFE